MGCVSAPTRSSRSRPGRHPVRDRRKSESCHIPDRGHRTDPRPAHDYERTPPRADGVPGRDPAGCRNGRTACPRVRSGARRAVPRTGAPDIPGDRAEVALRRPAAAVGERRGARLGRPPTIGLRRGRLGLRTQGANRPARGRSPSVGPPGSSHVFGSSRPIFSSMRSSSRPDMPLPWYPTSCGDRATRSAGPCRFLPTPTAMSTQPYASARRPGRCSSNFAAFWPRWLRSSRPSPTAEPIATVSRP
jgi:hypothetical protein